MDLSSAMGGDNMGRRTETNCPVVAIFREPILIEIEFETDTE